MARNQDRGITWILEIIKKKMFPWSKCEVVRVIAVAYILSRLLRTCAILQEKAIAEKASMLLHSKWKQHCSEWNNPELFHHEKRIGLVVLPRDAGLGNKMKSWRYAFFLSLVLERQLLIHFDVGFPVSDLLKPNLYNWLPNSEEKYDRWPTISIYCNNMTDGSAFGSLPDDFVLQLNKESWQCDFGAIVDNLPQMSSQKKARIRALWSQQNCYFLGMHKFSASVLAGLPGAFVNATKQITIHIRWGDKYFSQAISNSSRDTRLTSTSLSRCLSSMRRFSKGTDSSTYYYILTDIPDQTYKIARRYFGRHNSNVKCLSSRHALHTGRLNNNITESILSFKLAFRDMAAIMISDTMVAPASSTFSSMASFLSFKKPIWGCRSSHRILNRELEQYNRFY